MRALLFVLTLALAVIAALMALFSSFARAHDGSWIGDHYPECCSVSGGDCAKLPKQLVAYDPMGQLFLINLGSMFAIAEKDARISKDDDYWLCLTSDKQPRCFFRPPMSL